jgi:hypothetical protein
VLVVNALSADVPALQHLFRATLALTVASALQYAYLASASRSDTEGS